MKFIIDITRSRFSKKKAEVLMSLGFEFDFDPEADSWGSYVRKDDNNLSVEIESLEQLIEICKSIEEEVLIDAKNMYLYLSE